MKNPQLPDITKLSMLPLNAEKLQCLDIGANNGQFYIAFKNIFPKANVTMIEANPHCERRLRKLSSNYKIIGVSNCQGTLELISTKLKPYSKGASFYKEVNLKSLKEEDLLKINVPVDTLDNLFPNTTFDIIKIDVQGSEVDVIEGGATVLSKATYVLIEASLIEYNENAPLGDKIIEKMKDLGFTIEDLIDYHRDARGKIIQIDLLFSKNNETHNLNCVKEFAEQLGL
jgi:FkbM family methyltransferase